MTSRDRIWHFAALVPVLALALAVDVYGQPAKPFPGIRPRLQPPRRPARAKLPQRTQRPVGTPYGKGTKHLEVD